MKFRWRGKLVPLKTLRSFDFLVRVIFPFYVAVPAFSLILNVKIIVIRANDLGSVGGFKTMCFGVDLDAALVADAETGCFETLLEYPLIWALQLLLLMS